ncbi:MAG TPA: helix-turn-helix transcriptional regulator [Thermodesulfobacteriota bacterium]|nr:helix-turn-helix transcriptional regulator [Thermodesulfobacteriota bacterium]
MGHVKSGKLIGAGIKARRKELGLSQEKLAEALGVSYQQVQRYENGTNLLSTDKLQIIAKVLEVPVSYFFGESEEIALITGPGIRSDDAKVILNCLDAIDKRCKRCIMEYLLLVARNK